MKTNLRFPFQKVMGLFMLFLILLLPVSSASVLAGTITITKNSGQAGFDSFVNANDDTWTVEATISGLQEGETVAAENVQIKVGGSKKNFNSCTAQEAAAVCQYIEPLTGGITPDAYPFTVTYTPVSALAGGASDAKTAVINADGSAPEISFVQGDAKQEGSKVKLSFSVSDGSVVSGGSSPSLSPSLSPSKSSPCIGLAKVSVLDADSGAVLLAKEDFPEKYCDVYKFSEDNVYKGYLPAALESEGVRRLKIIAEDRLGLSTTSNIVSFRTDFVKPEINELNFSAFGKFLGVSEQYSPLIVKIKEKSNLAAAAVMATAAQTTLDKTPAQSCVRTKDDPNIWECTWKEVKVEPSSSLSVTFSAADAAGNLAETTLAQNFVTDTDAPVVEYFGPLLEYNNVGYVKNGQNTIIARIREQGSGMNKANVLAQLGSLSGGAGSASGGFKEPAECAQEGEFFVCYWHTSASFSQTSGDARISLVKVVDNVGNSAALPERNLIVDVVPPSLETLGLFGVSEGLAKNYFQSGDILRVTATVAEANGLFWLIDLRNVVNDAETQFPAAKINEAGWQTFKGEEVCTQNEEKSWDCSFETAAIKSGLLKNAAVVLKVRDSAGNFAVNWPAAAKNVEKRSSKSEEGKYAFDILAVKDEEKPDYWSAGKSTPLMDFVDLDAMVFPSRIPIQFSLKTDTPEVRALEIDLISCSPQQSEGSSSASSSSSSKSSSSKGAASTGAAEASGAAGSKEPTEDSTAASPFTGLAAALPEDELPTSTTGFPEISRQVIYGNIYPDGNSEPKPTIMLEFSPVSDVRSLLGITGERTFRGVNIPYVCQLKIYSRLGNTALKNAETQEIVLAVPFAFSALGSIDENLAQKVREMKESDFMKFANALEYANTAIAWINYVLGFMNTIKNVYELISLFSSGSVAAAAKLEDTGFLSTLGQALKGQCLSLDVSQIAGWKTLEYVNMIAQILNCNPRDPEEIQKANNAGDDKSTDWGLSWYGWWQRSVLDAYNKASGRDFLGRPADSLYENIYLSAAGLCIPGLIYNLHKAREIQCRQIVCYGIEVPAGVATYDSCDKLYDLQMCEFWAGPAVDLVPLMGGIAELGKILKNAGGFTPLGVLKVTEIAVCAALCFQKDESGFLYYSCKAVTGLNKVANIVNDIVSSIDNRPDIQGSPYCDAAETIDVDKLTGG